MPGGESPEPSIGGPSRLGDNRIVVCVLTRSGERWASDLEARLLAPPPCFSRRKYGGPPRPPWCQRRQGPAADGSHMTGNDHGPHAHPNPGSAEALELGCQCPTGATTMGRRPRSPLAPPSGAPLVAGISPRTARCTRPLSTGARSSARAGCSARVMPDALTVTKNLQGGPVDYQGLQRAVDARSCGSASSPTTGGDRQ